MSDIETKVNVKATAKLEDEVNKELQIPDPDISVAELIEDKEDE